MQRHAIKVDGLVQGVGFRPFVYQLAQQHGLSGFVQNRSGTVQIEVEGDQDRLRRFLEELQTNSPPLTQIAELTCRDVAVQHKRGFAILPSEAGGSHAIFISPDIAVCETCLQEMHDPADRRYRYPFLNCTACGPRLTVIRGAPYDRQQTTMADFPMCAACREEYGRAEDRRFHAQPTACPDCGPRLELRRGDGERVAARDPLAAFAAALLGGEIGALKGLGGFHLVCDARSSAAVQRLRQRKQRDEKPFALMVRDLAAAARLCQLTPAETALLASPRRPIVLCRRLAQCAAVSQDVAPGNPYLGLMLPYTPLHHLLFHTMGDVPLVMTSGNRSDEPIAYEDHDAIERLAGIADCYLTHNRRISVRCDDSVTRVVDGCELPVRRSRGYAPQPIPLPLPCPVPVLAVGGQLKSVFALGSGHRAVLSHHLGDLDDWSACEAFERDVRLYEELFQLSPVVIAHDLHPDYASTNYAHSRAAAEGLRTMAVQHHHAHLASCMAEHGLSDPVIGVIFDGAGYGPDGAVWGGEFLVGDYGGFVRAAHLRYVRLPGGDRAAREPWRMALAYLHDAGRDTSRWRGIDAARQQVVQQMIRRGVHSPWTSSAGRLFDAVAALAGGCNVASYEGQAAQLLEWLADDQPYSGSYPVAFEASDLGVGASEPALRQSRRWPQLVPQTVDTRPLIHAVCEDLEQGEPAAKIARRFHSAVCDLIVETCLRIRQQTGLARVVLGGGVFHNAVLTRDVVRRLREAACEPYRHRIVPPGDGGLCLGQLAIAAHQLGRLPAALGQRAAGGDRRI